ncbi:hypothetical protein [Klenkia sp. PcliD-1-E]|uniref:hypothetical protein n=1 Tax=Klenkia sp. PcliD-1-E TaxID=2954492 RepID=UPI0020976727|nr:hypothetical protein [Klenkia sp. PcliD-1-E]MCO7221513.1 hypothetical protein [Klenkia sp. PcliD-1-E]
MAQLTEEQKAQRAAARRHRAAIAAEGYAHRQERKRREWDANGTQLTRDEIEAGVHCRGCARPIIDGLGDWPPLMKLTEREKPEYDAAQADFAAGHKDCRSHRWSMSGSRAMHCGYCCPPPPLSDRQMERLGMLLRASRPDSAELRTWRLTLTCDHVIDVQQHKSHGQWTTNVRHCRTCDQTRGVVIAVPESVARG